MFVVALQRSNVKYGAKAQLQTLFQLVLCLLLYRTLVPAQSNFSRKT